MKTADFDYQLPPELIAQEPVEPRDSARLLVLDRKDKRHRHTSFRNIGDYLNPGDLVVVNRSRVVPARLLARKVPGGGKVEVLLLERVDPITWKALVGGKGVNIERQIVLEDGTKARIAQDFAGAQRLLVFDKPIDDRLEKIGQVPLPPYIRTNLKDAERYQTVYAREPGSAAAPTAGLHFTTELIDTLKGQGVNFTEVDLHIGLDTFVPVTEEDPRQHVIHSEWCSLSSAAAAQINQTRAAGGRIVAVGTTAVRVLETAGRINSKEGPAPFEGRTDLFILPGFNFRVVDALLTNFHLPRSTLLMMVSAFAGREIIRETYKVAIANRYRFYSFGDAMLIL